MKNLIIILYLLLSTCNLSAQKTELQSQILETYVTIEEFQNDSASVELLYDIQSVSENYIHIKRKLNPTSNEIDKVEYYGFKYKGVKYYNLAWSESSYKNLYVPLEIEGFFSLILMPKSELDPGVGVNGVNSMGVIASLILEKKARSVWKDRDNEKYYIMIVEPNIKGSAYYSRSKVSSKNVFGVYLSNVSRKRYNKNFQFNLMKKETTVEDWKDVVNELNRRYNEGELNYFIK